MPTTADRAAIAQRVRTIKTARAQTQLVRDAIRDEVCVPPRIKPGTSPKDYRYVVSESCVHKDARHAKRRTDVVSIAQTRNEVRILRAALGTGPVIVEDVSGSVLRVSYVVFKRLIESSDRIAIPNPLERYEAAVASLPPSSDKTVVVADLLPRRFILHLLLIHLVNALPILPPSKSTSK